METSECLQLISTKSTFKKGGAKPKNTSEVGGDFVEPNPPLEKVEPNTSEVGVDKHE